MEPVEPSDPLEPVEPRALEPAEHLEPLETAKPLELLGPAECFRTKSGTFWKPFSTNNRTFWHANFGIDPKLAQTAPCSVG